MFLFFSLYLLLFSSSYSLCFLLLVLVPLAHFLLKHFFSIFPQFFSINLGGTVFFLFSIRFFVFFFIRKYHFFRFFFFRFVQKISKRQSDACKYICTVQFLANYTQHWVDKKNKKNINNIKNKK